MEEEKITYAQQFLRELLSQRKLRSWSIQMEVPHASMFKIANGVMVPTYAIMCRLLPVIAPANCFFYVGEKFPTKRKLLSHGIPQFRQNLFVTTSTIGKKWGSGMLLLNLMPETFF